MSSYDPTTEMEISRRTLEAMVREQRSPHIELHRRVIDARNRARHVGTDDLLRRIAATLTTA